MIGFRLLAIVLGVLCLAGTVALVLQSQPFMTDVTDFFINRFLPPGEVQNFFNSSLPRDIRIKAYIKYVVSGYAVVLLGLAILFFISAFNPLRMRPFITVVMIGCIAWMGIAIWKGLSLGLYYLWWVGDAVGCLIVLVLLAALYPREPAGVLQPEESEGLGSEL